MSDNKNRPEALIHRGTERMIARSGGLVRRGLNQILKLKQSDPWEELRQLAQELIFDAYNEIGMEFVLIPAGKFMMGSETKDDETPIHEVTITKPFYMTRDPASQFQWRAVMSVNPEHFTNDDEPVFGVSWDDVQEFIRTLNGLNPMAYADSGSWRKVQFDYRLPTEAEWEYACRAGLTGDVTAADDAMDRYGDSPRGRSIQPLGTTRPNAFGLYNMVVGFKEWCEDRYHINYNGAPSDGSAWGEVAGKENRVPQMNRVARGSLSGSPDVYKRASARTWAAPSSRGVIFSFRLVAVESSRKIEPQSPAMRLASGNEPA